MSRTILIMKIVIGIIFLFFLISLFATSVGNLRRKILTNDQFKTCVTIFFGLATTTGVLFSIFQIQENHEQRMYDQKYVQAKKISAWDQSTFAKNHQLIRKVRLNNSSSQPVYDVFVFLKENTPGAENFIKDRYDIPIYTHVTTLPPGKTTVSLESSGYAAGRKFEIPEIYFTDVNNVNWSRNKFGKLTEEHDYKSRFKRLGITPPYLDDEEELEKQW